MESKYSIHDIKRVHAMSSLNKQLISSVSFVSCLHCTQEFASFFIVEWIDRGDTAVCPMCGIDAVVPRCFVEDQNFLLAIRDHYFKEKDTTNIFKTEDKVPLTFEKLQQDAHDNSCVKGFWKTDGSPEHVRLSAKVALIHSEVSEVLECLRDKDPHETWYKEDGKPEGVGAELADIMIRVADFAEHCGIDLETRIVEKMKYNKTRPSMHGKRL